MNMPPYDPDRLVNIKDMHRSVSQAKQYLAELGGCSYQYFLSRVVKAWERPAAWLPQGLAVHEACEFFERSNRTCSLEQMLQAYKEAYVKHTRRLLKDTPNPRFWFASGPYKGQDDIKRRAQKGLEQTERYYDYYVNQKPGDVIWYTPKGEPAIELGFSATFGGVTVRGYIDQILGNLFQDVKTGKKPGDLFQLGTYRFGILDTYGVDFTLGQYWMGDKGRPVPVKPKDLTTVTREYLDDVYGRVDAGIKAEEFPPSPDEKKCMFCPVAKACAYAV